MVGGHQDIKGGYWVTESRPHQKTEIEDRILFALKGIRYGSVEIIVHDSKVVQIERKEKMRFDS